MVSIGIYIGQDSICFAELSLEGTQPSLNSVNEYFFQPQDSQEEKNHLILSHFKEIKQKYKGQVLRFCYGLSQNRVTSFPAHFPFKEKFKILKTLPFEVEAQSPFSPNKSFFDTRICRIKEQQSSQTLCFVTPEENVKDFLKWELPFKTHPYLLSCEGAALANLLEFWNKPLSQAQKAMPHSLYLYLGEQNSQVLFYQDGFFTQIFTLDWATADIVKKMKHLYKLTAKQAWEEYFAKSFILTEVKGFTQDQRTFSNMIKKQLQLLIPKLKLFKMSFETEQQILLEDIAVFGPGAVIKNLTAFLTAELDTKVLRLKTLNEYPYLEGENKPSSFVAFGLALEGLKKSPYKGLNFLQSLQKTEFSLLPKQGLRMALAIFLCFAIFTTYAILRKQESLKVLNKVRAVFLSYGTKIAHLKKSRINLESIQSFLNKNKNITEDEQTVRDKLNEHNPMDHLQLITRKFSDVEKWNLNIHYLKLRGRSVEIKGSVNPSSLPNLKSQLKDLAKGKISEDSTAQPKTMKTENLGKVAHSKVQKKEPPALTTSPSTSKQKASDKTSQESQRQEDSLSSENTESTKTEESSFFSYSFTLKDTL